MGTHNLKLNNINQLEQAGYKYRKEHQDYVRYIGSSRWHIKLIRDLGSTYKVDIHFDKAVGKFHSWMRKDSRNVEGEERCRILKIFKK